MTRPTVLTIAGSDSGGGAGIQADLRAFARCGVHGTCAITAVTAQNTRAVVRTEVMAPAVVVAQVRAVVADFDVAAVKVGMLGDGAVARAVAEVLARELAGVPVVVDPVLAATTGTALVDQAGAEILIGELLPLATVVTPNADEARALLTHAGRRAAIADDVAEIVTAIVRLGPSAAVLTGWTASPRREADPEITCDIFSDGEAVVEISAPRVAGDGAHGSGCTHSAALAASLALGHTPLEAARRAQQITVDAIAHRLDGLGSGLGPADALHGAPSDR